MFNSQNTYIAIPEVCIRNLEHSKLEFVMKFFAQEEEDELLWRKKAPLEDYSSLL
jgi:hypothetical protein